MILVILAGLPAAAGTITLVADKWPPFNMEPGIENEGYMVDIARKVFEAEGIQVAYEVLPWKRAVEMTREGKFDGVIGASKIDAESFVFPDEELARNRLSFYVKEGSTWQFRSKASLDSITLGTIVGYDYRVWLNDYIDKYREDDTRVQIMTGEDPLKRNLLKLMSGRIGALVDTEAAIRYLADEMDLLDKIKCAGYGDKIAYIYIAFSPSNPNSRRYAEILSKGIVQLRNSGDLRDILKKYGLTDWK